MADETKKSSNLLSPLGTFNYPTLFVPRVPNNSAPGTKARYSVDVWFAPLSAMAPEDQARYKALQNAAVTAAVDKWGREKVAVWLKEGKLNMPFKKDVESKGMDPSRFETYIKPWSTQQPGVVSIYRDPKTGKPLPVTVERQIYSGAEGRVSLRVWCFDTEGNRGVSFGLANVQKVRDGERLDGRSSAEDEFEATEDAGTSDLGGESVAAGTQDELAQLLGG